MSKFQIPNIFNVDVLIFSFNRLKIEFEEFPLVSAGRCRSFFFAFAEAIDFHELKQPFPI